ncbi:MAG: carboxypeptidase-like regulatory domain-containing protein [Bryobacteraceae bacterium]|jgi:hypothetical protein
MNRLYTLFLLAASVVSAAVIRGSVLENETGYPLANAIVTLQRIATGSAANSATLRSDARGNFEFASLPAGVYILKAERRGFLPGEYGQRQWNSAGTPVVLTADGQAFLVMRLHRFGGITGIVRDENEVGIPDQEVVAYHNSEPPQLVAHGITDDRGIYRVAGLEPGNYLIRTMGEAASGVSYIPTFSRQTLRVEEAQTVPVYLGEDARNVDVRPIPGKLLSLAGAAGPIPDGFTTTVTLASDMGRRSSGNPFSFAGLPPGPYEIHVEARENPPGSRLLGGYTQLNLDRALTNFAVAMREVRETQFEFRGGDASAVMARRKDLAGTGLPLALQLNDNRALLAPGRWELMVLPPPGYYVTQFAPARRDSSVRPDGWNEVTIPGNSSVRANLSGGASSVHGMVKTAGEPVVGAPVFLEAWNPDTRKRLTELHFTRTGMDGSYRIESLVPGTYRVLATFEYLTPDSAAMDLAGAQTVNVEGLADLQLDLDLYGSR